ncbi:MAG: helix-turn-helix transcriptional regulator [Eubacteriales bacterium]|nr:helix-turn-helix transcriptional regulator [Eubacteriales bacterium]MDD3882108.1 helix-turn-helix transcriptional regulator [Eubacteriales bacterium]MDD4513213.1 helix-turn-helix transcriptional regulator [Eubacteriales bacterium]
MGKKTGAAIKKARLAAELTQEKLAKKIAGLSAADLGKAERGELELTNETLKRIAKETGVTQTSLLNAEKKTATKSAAKSTKTTAAKAQKSGVSAVKLTAAEKRLVEAYRNASSDDRKQAINILIGKDEAEGFDLGDVLGNVLGGLGGLGELLGQKGK